MRKTKSALLETVHETAAGLHKAGVMELDLVDEALNRTTAHRSAIRREILAILKRTAVDYEAHGDPASDLRDAPEYLLTVDSR